MCSLGWWERKLCQDHSLATSTAERGMSCVTCSGFRFVFQGQTCHTETVNECFCAWSTEGVLLPSKWCLPNSTKQKLGWRSIVTGHTNPPARGGDTVLSLVLSQYKSPTRWGTHRSHIGTWNKLSDSATWRTRSTSSYWRQNKIQCIPALETPRHFPGLI